ncbi:hypothetical protein C770_GR4Chr2301 [Sinorhizobium meliloti GR4]|nr:hypothetical protein C770_GR4Chr2301 [Sinorhizobium meliloti GR4]
MTCSLTGTVGRQFPHAPHAWLGGTSGVIERIEQIRSGLIEAHEEHVILGVERTVKVERPFFSPVGEDDDIIERHQGGHQSPECAADSLVIHRRAVHQPRHRLKKSVEVDAQTVLPARSAALGYTPSTGRFGLKYLSWGIYRPGRF